MTKMLTLTSMSCIWGLACIEIMTGQDTKNGMSHMMPAMAPKPQQVPSQNKHRNHEEHAGKHVKRRYPCFCLLPSCCYHPFSPALQLLHGIVFMTSGDMGIQLWRDARGKE